MRTLKKAVGIVKKLLLSAVLLFVAWTAPVSACDGHYEVRYETVLVAPAHSESRFVYAPVFNCGRCLTQGYYVSVAMPPQYATRAVQVFVPDPPRVYYQQPACDDRSWYFTVRGLFGRR